MKTEEIIDNIKTFLTDVFDYDSWEQFVDNQEMGDCQLIVSYIFDEFKDKININKVFGEIEVDVPSTIYDYKTDEEEINFNFTHHWVEIDGVIYDFSKGTLIDNIDWYDKYDVSIIDNEWRYAKI